MEKSVLGQGQSRAPFFSCPAVSSLVVYSLMKKECKTIEQMAYAEYESGLKQGFDICRQKILDILYEECAKDGYQRYYDIRDRIERL